MNTNTTKQPHACILEYLGAWPILTNAPSMPHGQRAELANGLHGPDPSQLRGVGGGFEVLSQNHIVQPLHDMTFDRTEHRVFAT